MVTREEIENYVNAQKFETGLYKDIGIPDINKRQIIGYAVVASEFDDEKLSHI